MPWNDQDHRQMKRAQRKFGICDPVEQAFNEGQVAYLWPNELPPRLRANPYPPGRRHAEYERGFQIAKQE